MLNLNNQKIERKSLFEINQKYALRLKETDGKMIGATALFVLGFGVLLSGSYVAVAAVSPVFHGSIGTIFSGLSIPIACLAYWQQ